MGLGTFGRSGLFFAVRFRVGMIIFESNVRPMSVPAGLRWALRVSYRGRRLFRLVSGGEDADLVLAVYSANGHDERAFSGGVLRWLSAKQIYLVPVWHSQEVVPRLCGRPERVVIVSFY